MDGLAKGNGGGGGGVNPYQTTNQFKTEKSVDDLADWNGNFEDNLI